MEAKEKAQELVDKYRTTIRKADVYGNLASEDEIYLAKECALIAVEEIIKEKQECHKFECYGNDIEYWQQVKTEIEQL